MIVKNEEQFLPRCLETIKGVVDEIIIVDTGSTDRTVEIARQYTDKVYFHPWNDDFSEARNVSLGYATGDWVLQIDADEELEREDVPLLYKVIQSDLYNAVFVTILNKLSGGQWGKHRFQRLFRRGKAHYEGIVHNQLVYEGEAAVAEIRIYHYGYSLSPAEMRAKYERSSALLRKQIAEDPLNTFARQNLIHAMRAVQDFEGMLAEGEAALNAESPHTTPAHRQQIRNDMAYALLQLGRYEEAEALCKEVLEEVPFFLDALFNLATTYMVWGRLDEALHYYKRFLEVKRDEVRHPHFTQLIVDLFDFESRVYLNMGVCYERLGELDKAISSYRQAITYDEHLLNPYIGLAQLLMRQGNIGEATNILEKARGSGIVEPPLHFYLGNLYYRQGFYEQAETTFRQALEQGESADVFNGLALALLQDEDRLGEALDAVRKGLALSPKHVGLWVTMAHIASRQGQPEGIREACEKILGNGATQAPLYPELARLCIGVAEYQTAIRMIERHLETAPPSAEALSDLATCYAELGQWQAALTGYRAALGLDPRCPSAIANLKRLQRHLEG
jgi:tetratricopeptide (TPR) repeat protein